MLDGIESQTAIAAGVLRAAHQILDQPPRIVDDPISLDLVPGSSAIDIEAASERLELPFMRTLRSSFLLRSRIAEDALEAATAAGARKYVILGAGFDTFAYRQPGWARSLEIFELDHPASQRAKRMYLTRNAVAFPPNLQLCPIDFESETPSAVLARAGFDSRSSSVYSWLGVIPYLTSAAVESTLSEIVEHGTQTTVVLSYVVPDSFLTEADAEAVSISSTAAAQRGEPWLSRFEPHEIEHMLRSLGCDSITHYGPDEFEAEFMSQRSDGLPVPSFERVLIASRRPTA